MELKLIFIFLKRWWWVLVLGLLLGSGGGYLISHYQSPVYRSSSRVLITGDSSSLDNATGRQSLQELVGTYTQLLLTQSTASLAAERLGYPVRPGKISVRAIPNTKLFEVTYESSDPKKAADTVNILVAVLVEQNDTLQNNRVLSSASGLKSQIDEVKAQINDLEDEVSGNYQLLRDQKKDELSSQITEKETAISNLKREILNLTVQYNDANLAEATAQIEETSPDQVPPTPETPPLTLEQQSTLDDKQAQLDQLQSDLTRYQQAYFDLVVLGQFEPGQETAEGIRLNQIQANLDLYQQLYSNLLTEYETARMTNLNATTSVVQVDPAVAPSFPLRPRPFTNVIFGATIGLLLAGVVSYMIEYMDDSLKTETEIQQIFDVPVLGRVINDRGAFKKQEVHAALHPRSPVSESLRSLRTNLEFARVDQPLKSILVTSANPGEGKTTVVVNLAAVIAQAGKRVLVVDADLRRPALHEYFKISNQIGLTNVLIGQTTLENAIQSMEDGYIMVIPSGPIPPNPAELLRSAKMSQLLEEMEEKADVILIDSPPVVVADASVLAAKASGVLVIVRHAKTRKGIAVAMVQQLRGVQARIIGVVLNSIKSRNRSDYYYYTGYYNSASKNGRENGQNEPKKQKADQKLPVG